MQLCATVEHVASNAIAFNGQAHAVGRLALELRGVVAALGPKFGVDVRRRHFVVSAMRHRLLQNLERIHDSERLDFMELLSEICPYSLDYNADASVSGVLIDMLDCASFLRADMFVRSCLARRSEKRTVLDH